LGVGAQTANFDSPNFLVALNDEQATLVERVQKSLVEVRNGREGFGAGVIWRPDGIIVTNAHVVHRQSLHVALRDGRTLDARLLAYDQANDIAALATDATNLDAIDLGDSEALLPGQLVLALGHPWGVPRAVTAGVVIGSGAHLPESPRANREWIAVSLRLRPGNSGGPLVDALGRLLGLNTMMTGPDFGMAVPAHVIRKFMREALGSSRYV
jgi:serine protease Do